MYNSFAEVVFSLNRCREGLAATALQSQGQGPEDVGSCPGDMLTEDLVPTVGPSPAARAKRDVIYTCEAAACTPLSLLHLPSARSCSVNGPVKRSPAACAAYYRDSPAKTVGMLCQQLTRLDRIVRARSSAACMH